jgi:PqqD family protein of HPr-rel-A system
VDEARYLATAPETLRIAGLDGLTAIYHRASAQTHIVAEPVPAILSALTEAITAPDLLAALGAEAGEAEALAERLAELEAIGLIERL